MDDSIINSSRKVVYAALAGNVLVAAAKYGAAAVSGSGAMLTEAIHSSTDCVNQLLLLIGDSRSRARPDESHPFGYGLEMYFWTVVVAVMVLLAGGAVSILEGVHKFHAPTPVKSPGIIFAVLAVSAVFEGTSFLFGYRGYRRTVRGRRVDGREVGLWTFIKMSTNPSLYESLLEDGAALISLVIASSGLVASVVFGVKAADGIASIAIGGLLVLTSFAIARATQSLIAGESAAKPVRDDIARVLRELGHPLEESKIRTLQLGPAEILVALTMAVADGTPASQLKDDLRAISAKLRDSEPRVSYVLFEVEGE